MDWVNRIREAIVYIEDNLLEEINSETVGRAINYAPSSFQSLFGAMTGYSIGEYIRLRRLSRAAGELYAGNTTVTDAAFKYGYKTVEAFSKAFKRLFDVSPSVIIRSGPSVARFDPIRINFELTGGFGMIRNLIPGMMRVDWSDKERQNEFVNSVVSSLGALGEKFCYDEVCAVSGCAFRTSFSMPSVIAWNHGNYNVIHTPAIIEHTFRMLGYETTRYQRRDYATDKRLITDSIDKGVPVITLEGVINCADACVISGYDRDGDVLLGYNPFMDVEHDHSEEHDDTGYFRKSGWYDGYFAVSNGEIVIIEGKREKLSREAVFAETLKLIRRLILEETMVPGQYNGLAAHRAFANALLIYAWEDNSEPYMNVMCNEKQYIDRQYAASFLRGNGRADLAGIYEEIAGESNHLLELIPQDFSALSMFSDREKLRPFCETVLRICDLEERAAAMM